MRKYGKNGQICTLLIITGCIDEGPLMDDQKLLTGSKCEKKNRIDSERFLYGIAKNLGMKENLRGRFAFICKKQVSVSGNSNVWATKTFSYWDFEKRGWVTDNTLATTLDKISISLKLEENEETFFNKLNKTQAQYELQSNASTNIFPCDPE